MSNLHVIIRTPSEEVLYLGNVTSLTVNTDLGPMVVMNHHASLTATVLSSPVLVKTESLEERYVVRRGVMSVDNEKNTVTLLAYACEKLSSLSKQKVSEYLKSVKEMLKSGKHSTRQMQYLREEEIAMDQQLKVISK